MNFSKSVHPQSKGSFVWKRQANTSETKRKNYNNSQKIRITSQSSDYSNLGETELSLNIKTSASKNIIKKAEWLEIKSMAKYSTIASRMELKKSVPISFLDFTDKKSPKREKTKSTVEYNTFDRMIDSQGNLTKSFKDTKEFKSLNPHISKDVDKMKKRVYSMYQQEKKKMNNFLGQSETVITNHESETENSKSIGFLTNYDGDNEMQRISERQEYESRMNSTRIKENKNEQLKSKEKENKGVKRSFTKKEQHKNISEKVPYFVKSSNSKNGIGKIEKSSCSVLSEKEHNPLLKGLLGEYSNYEKLTKHELIEKLISLEYLAQNIFKKNKFLQEENDKKDILLKESVKLENKNNLSKAIQEEKENNINLKETFTKKELNESRNLFVINNDDGYFNEFLESEKEKEKEVEFEMQDNMERFNENLNDF